ncbi:MAG TPA: dihydrofolate reductase family protein [Marmoricola sp.]|nr:dihydrofolate reductase family protein [Marmoricola sp.]
MNKLLYSATMSLDGFIAGPGGDMSWLADVGSLDVDVDGLMAQVGALLVGRRTFDGDDPNAGTDAAGAFGGRWEGHSVVLTHRPPDSSPPGVTFATDLEEAVRTAKAAAGGKYVNVLGADVARQCLAAGLLDEVLVFVAPVLLGDGTRLFAEPGGARVALEPLPGRTRDGLWYRVVA